jgi:hypothetical protein
MAREVYKSSTLGSIPLSFTGRHLLQSLREEMTALVRKAYENGRKDARQPLPGLERFAVSSNDWEPLSVARGKLAQYMSGLEEGSKSVDQLERHNVDLRGEVVKLLKEKERLTDVITCRMAEIAALCKENEQLKEHVQFRSAPEATNITEFHLPPIPEGYELTIVGNAVAISPIRDTIVAGVEA